MLTAGLADARCQELHPVFCVGGGGQVLGCSFSAFPETLEESRAQSGAAKAQMGTPVFVAVVISSSLVFCSAALTP